MQQVTRTLNKYEIKAFAVIEVDGEPKLEVVAKCSALQTSMTKGQARSLLKDEAGQDVPRGAVIQWTPVGKKTFAMPLDIFLTNSAVVCEEN